MVDRDDFGTTLAPLPGTHRYRITISNTSNLGAINSFQWYPPTGVHIVKVLGSTEGHCTLTGLTGFGGNQFPTVVLLSEHSLRQARSQAPELHLPGGRRRRDDLVRHRQGLSRAASVTSGCARRLSSFDRIPSYSSREHGASR